MDVEGGVGMQTIVDGPKPRSDMAPPTTTFYKTSSHSLSPFLRYAPFIVICLSTDINQVSFSSLSLVDRGHPKSSRSSSAAFSVEAIGRCDRSLRVALFVILVAFLIGLAAVGGRWRGVGAISPRCRIIIVCVMIVKKQRCGKQTFSLLVHCAMREKAC